jgi:hypothetical protein
MAVVFLRAPDLPERQVLIPAEAHAAAALNLGHTVSVLVVGPRRIEIISTADLVTRLAGSMSGEDYPDGYLNEPS